MSLPRRIANAPRTLGGIAVSAGWRLVWIALLFLLTKFALNAGQPTEYQVKAAFLLNFAKFVDWPPIVFRNEHSPVVIGIVGEDPFGDVLPTLLRIEKVKNRSVEIRYFTPADDPSGCHLLFVSRLAASQAAGILTRVSQRPVLTVSESGDFLKAGGMIDFVIVKESVRFDIDAKAMEKAGLKPSSKLLVVARSVKTKHES